MLLLPSLRVSRWRGCACDRSLPYRPRADRGTTSIAIRAIPRETTRGSRWKGRVLARGGRSAAAPRVSGQAERERDSRAESAALRRGAVERSVAQNHRRDGPESVVAAERVQDRLRPLGAWLGRLEHEYDSAREDRHAVAAVLGCAEEPPLAIHRHTGIRTAAVAGPGKAEKDFLRPRVTRNGRGIEFEHGARSPWAPSARRAVERAHVVED